MDQLAHADHPDVVGNTPSVPLHNVAPTPKVDEYGLPVGLAVKKQAMGIWELLVTGQHLSMANEEIEQCLAIIAAWRKVFAEGVVRTRIAREFGAPSAIIRLDYFWKKECGVQLCEVEERPAGMFATAVINRKFRGPLMQALHGVEHAFGKPLAFCVSGQRASDSDDHDFVTQYRWGNGPTGGFEPTNCPHIVGLPSEEMLERYVWWVRSHRTEEEYHPLEEHAVSVISQEGDKSYGVAMGRWFPIDAHWRHVIPFETGCVLKPRYGSRFEHSLIVHTEARRLKDDRLPFGVHGWKPAIKAITEGRVAYWQPLYPPESHKFLGDSGYRVLRRAYFSFDFESGRYVPMGGAWFAHNSMRIHGADNALAGPLRLPS